MKIGIVGAGNIGGTLVRRLVPLGHDVVVANSRGPETLRDLAEETGATAVRVDAAARERELVVVTIPLISVPELPDDLLAGAAGDLVVVDTCNYYAGRDGEIEPVAGGTPSSRWVEGHLGRPVIKAFNTIYYRHLLERGLPAGAEGRMAIPVAGDDDRPKRVVMDLVEELGFDPVDSGGLDDSWRQEPDTPAYGAGLGAEDTRRALAEAER